MCFPGRESLEKWVSQLGEHISLGVRACRVGEHMPLGICVSQVGEYILLGICVSQVREQIWWRICVLQGEEHISLEMGFTTRGTHITWDTCLPGGGTHITRDMCFSGREHISLGICVFQVGMCLPGGGTHITRDMCFPGWEHISLGICVSQVGEATYELSTLTLWVKHWVNCIWNCDPLLSLMTPFQLLYGSCGPQCGKSLLEHYRDDGIVHVEILSLKTLVSHRFTNI